MAAGPHVIEKADNVVDVIVETKAARRRRNVTGVGPIGDVDVVISDEGPHRVAEQRGEVT